MLTSMRMSWVGVVLVVSLWWVGCASRPAGVEGGPGWRRTELYFALGDWEETMLTAEAELRWDAFLKEEVTPRFPDGLTVFEAYGQWREDVVSPVLRERSRVLVILHPTEGEAGAKIEEIREAWKRLTGEASVLMVTQAAEVKW